MKTKKIRFQYMENEEVMKHINKQPFHLKSDWVRSATKEKMKRDQRNEKI